MYYSILFIEQYKLKEALRYNQFCKNIPIQPYGIKYFQGRFAQNFVNFIKNLSSSSFFKLKGQK